MKYFEVSRKVDLVASVSEQDLKQAILDRVQRAFVVSNFVENDHGFDIQVKTGGRESLIKHSHAHIHVRCVKEKTAARFFVHGTSKVSASLSIWYTVLFFAVLLLGLLPGSIETSAENSGAIDVLVFMIFGIFTFYDIDKKLNEAKLAMEAALLSVDVEFSS